MKRPQYFAAKPTQDNTITVQCEIELWRAVLDQALQDISYMGHDKEFLGYKKEAEEWLLYEEDDFNTVCDFAFLEPEKTKEEFYYIMGVANDRRTKHGETSKKD